MLVGLPGETQRRLRMAHAFIVTVAREVLLLHVPFSTDEFIRTHWCVKDTPLTMSLNLKERIMGDLVSINCPLDRA